MDPHELRILSAAELSSLFCTALAQKTVTLANDVFTQLESRFHRLSSTAEGSQEFLEGFLVLAGGPEMRSFHISDPLTKCVARLEYLLDMAGERARAITSESSLRQIVASRERGFDLIRALSSAPEHGFTAGQLAARLRITPQNLSPLIRAFHAHGIVDRTQKGKNTFLKLTTDGRRLLASSQLALSARHRPLRVRESADALAHNKWAADLEKIIEGIRNTPYPSKKAAFGVACHGFAELAKENDDDPERAELFRNIADDLKRTIGVPA